MSGSKYRAEPALEMVAQVRQEERLDGRVELEDVITEGEVAKDRNAELLGNDARKAARRNRPRAGPVDDTATDLVLRVVAVEGAAIPSRAR